LTQENCSICHDSGSYMVDSITMPNQQFEVMCECNEDLIECSCCCEKFTEDMIKDWDNKLCEECWIDQGINSMESRYDLD